jgi:uncharacterized protein YcbX
MKITALQTTPIKGAMLRRPDTLDIGCNGVETNRRFFLIDGRGLMFNGKRNGRLARLGADYDPASGRLSVQLPGGRTVTGVPQPFGDEIETSFYGRPVAGHEVDGPFSEALSEYVGQPVRLLASDRPGDAIDVHPVTIISSASIAALAERMPGDEIDRRRFRMLVEVDGCDAHAEDGWIGQEVTLGDAVVRVEGPVPRCVVTTHNPDTGVRDADTLRAIVEYRGARAADELDTPIAHLPDNGKVVFGVYASVVTPGVVRVGDAAAVGASARAA